MRVSCGRVRGTHQSSRRKASAGSCSGHRNFDLAKMPKSVNNLGRRHDYGVQAIIPQYTATFVLDEGLKPALASESRTAAKIVMMCMNLHVNAMLRFAQARRKGQRRSLREIWHRGTTVV